MGGCGISLLPVKLLAKGMVIQIPCTEDWGTVDNVTRVNHLVHVETGARNFICSGDLNVRVLP